MADGAAHGQQGAAHAGRYAAFISYSHADEEFGDWLHKRLESYQVPAALVGRDGPSGPVGKRLGKVFRDRADLSAAHDLGAEIRAGLENADALIVLCSPRSCGSKYVNQEIAAFKALGKGQRIFAAIVDGEPHAAGNPNYTAADECFPPALIYRIDAGGALTSTPEPNEPIAADFRDGKDGRENGSLKIIAGLLGVGLDELVQRERQAERARRRRANMIAAAMAVLALGAVAGGGFAWVNQIEAEKNAREREEQRGIAVSKAEEARIQELAAIANAEEASTERDNARNSLARIFAERSWQAKESGDYPLAARYALAGWRAARVIAGERAAPANQGEYRNALGSILHDGNESRRLSGHESVVSSASFSPDGTRIVTASWDNSARVWDSSSGRAIATLSGHEGRVWSASFSPDGTRIVTASYDRTARVWDSSSGRAIATLSGHEREVVSASFSPDGTRIVTASWDSTARVWDSSSGRAIATLSGHEGRVWSASFSPDGTRIVTASADGTARVWDAGPNTPDDRRAIATLSGHERDVLSASFSPDGTRIVTASLDSTARVWDASPNTPDDGRAIATLSGHEGLVLSASFSPDGTRIVTASDDRTARVWDASSGRAIATLSGHESEVWSASFSPDGTRIVTASFDRTARVWDASPNTPDDRRAIATLSGHEGLVLSASFSPDGARIVTASDDRTARVWDSSSGRAIATLSGHEREVRSASFSPDGTRIVTASQDGTARVWDVRRLTQPMPALARAACTNFLSPAGRRFSAREISADPLIREVWLRGHSEDRDVCEGVPGAPALAALAPQ